MIIKLAHYANYLNGPHASSLVTYFSNILLPLDYSPYFSCSEESDFLNVVKV